jgi:O-antigen/teichoic acid export membrane protein
MSWLAVPFMLIYGHFFLYEKGTEFLIAFSLATLLLPFFCAPNTWYTFYEADLNFKEVAWRIIIQTVVVSLVLAMSIVLKLPLPALVVVYLLGSALFSWKYYFHISKKITRSAPSDQSAVDVRYGLKVTLQKFFVSLSENLPIILIPFFFGFFIALSGLLGGISAIYLPFMFKNEQQKLKRKILENIFVGILSFIIFRVFISVCFLFFYGEPYRESLQIVEALSWLILLLPLRIFFVNLLTVKKKNTSLVFIYAISNIVAAAALWLMRFESVFVATSLYIITLQVLLFMFVLATYFFTASKKIDSI